MKYKIPVINLKILLDNNILLHNNISVNLCLYAILFCLHNILNNSVDEIFYIK